MRPSSWIIIIWYVLNRKRWRFTLLYYIILYKTLSDFNGIKGKSRVKARFPSWLRNIIIISTTRILLKDVILLRSSTWSSQDLVWPTFLHLDFFVFIVRWCFPSFDWDLNSNNIFVIFAVWNNFFPIFLPR